MWCFRFQRKCVYNVESTDQERIHCLDTIWHTLDVCTIIPHQIVHPNFICFLTPAPTMGSSHYFILSFCGKPRLYYSDKSDNDFLLCCTHNIYVCSLQVFYKPKIWRMWHIFYCFFTSSVKKWLPFNYHNTFNILVVLWLFSCIEIHSNMIIVYLHLLINKKKN